MCAFLCAYFCVVAGGSFYFQELVGRGRCVCVCVCGGGGGLSDSFVSFLALGVWSKTESLVERYREMPRDTERC